jgi:hypothetical protein
MNFLHVKYRSRRWALLKSTSLWACQRFSLAALPLFALLCGCGGGGSQITPPPSTFSLSGTISPQSAGSGATVALSGSSVASTTADSSGNYSFSGLANGNYTVTPSRSGYAFSPSVKSVTIAGSNVSGIDFTGAVTHSVQLNWQASTSTVAGYNVYRGTTNDGPYTQINTTLVTPLTYTDFAVSSSTTYYYVATAVDPNGVESVYSGQVSATIP